MKLIFLLASLTFIASPVMAGPEAAGLGAIQELGRVNGQALACNQMASASQAKTLMILHAPKSRQYGEVFEEATNTAFLAQGKNPQNCPQLTEFTATLAELATRLQTTLPLTQ